MDVRQRLNTKKKISWAALYMALVIMLVGVYFVPGLFTLPDVTLFNYGENLTYIFLHSFHNMDNGMFIEKAFFPAVLKKNCS